MIEEIASLSDVSFIDNKTLDDVQSDMVTDYQTRYKEVTGQDLTLRRADPEALKLYAASVQIYHMMLHIDMAGKMDLLKYAYSGFLDNLGALRGVTRLAASPATTTVRFTLSAAQKSVVTIPKGTRVSNGDVIYFETSDLAEIKIGETYIDVLCTCQESGAEGNGLIAGTINTLVDPIAYVDKVSNVNESTGGSDIESDDDLAERIYLAPGSYSTAGPKDAYIYHTKSYRKHRRKDKQMGEFKFETQGTSSFLTYCLDEAEAVDTLSMGMINNNQIDGILPFQYLQIDRQRYFKFRIGGECRGVFRGREDDPVPGRFLRGRHRWYGGKYGH